MQDSATDIQYRYHALINKFLSKVHSALMITYKFLHGKMVLDSKRTLLLSGSEILFLMLKA